MNFVSILAKKRDGAELSGEEIRALVDAYASGDLPDYQMAAWAMAVYLRGMTTEETAALTDAMLASGEVFRWDGVYAGGPPCVDKHSSGGVGDKVSLPLAAALAACGVRVPMISGRGLGATGGTLDKLEAIPGFRVDLDTQQAQRIATEVGCVICAASPRLVPADRKLYALRDVTATVPSIPLITASIMSKKLAEGLDALVLDVKCGSGAFMKTPAEARALARSLVATGRRMGVATTALVTDMSQPLGRMAGGALEVDESLECLAGAGPTDLRELTVRLGGEALLLAGGAESAEEGERRVARSLDDGTARERFAAMVAAQGGDLNAPRPLAGESIVRAPRAGRLASIQTESLGWAVIEMGGGRKKLGDTVDPSVGLEMLARVGQRVEIGEPVVRLYTHEEPGGPAHRLVADALRIADEAEALVPPTPPPLVLERIDA